MTTVTLKKDILGKDGTIEVPKGQTFVLEHISHGRFWRGFDVLKETELFEIGEAMTQPKTPQVNYIKLTGGLNV